MLTVINETFKLEMAEKIFDTISREMRYLEYKIKLYQAKRRRKKEKQNKSDTPELASDNIQHHKSRSQDHANVVISPHANDQHLKRRSSERSPRQSKHSTFDELNIDPWGIPSQGDPKQDFNAHNFDPWSSANATTQNCGKGFDLNETVRGFTPTTYKFDELPNPACLLPHPPKTLASNSLSSLGSTSPVQFIDQWTSKYAPKTATAFFPSISPSLTVKPVWSFDAVAHDSGIETKNNFVKDFDQIAFDSQPENLVSEFPDVFVSASVNDSMLPTAKKDLNSQSDEKIGETFLGNDFALVDLDHLVSRTRRLKTSKEFFNLKANRISLHEMKNDNNQHSTSTASFGFVPNTQQNLTLPNTQQLHFPPNTSSKHPEFSSSNNPFRSQQSSMLETDSTQNNFYFSR